MIRDNFFAKEATTSIIRNWQAGLLLLAGLLLVVACTGATPVEDAVAIPPSGEIGAPSPQSNSDSTASGDASAPSQRPSAGYFVANATTDSEATNSRPLPNSEDSSARRIPDTPAAEPSQLLPKDTLALVMAVSGGSSSSTLKTIVNDSSTGAMVGTKFIQLESSSKSVVLYLPDTGESTVLNSYSSPSWAPHFKRPYTVNDRLYISDKYTDGGAMTITEYATSDLSRGAE